MRLKLSSVERASIDEQSIQAFISSTLRKPEPGVIIYTPKHGWSVTYIRYQDTEQYNFHTESKYVVEISTVGEYKLKDQDRGHIIKQKNLTKHNEINV